MNKHDISILVIDDVSKVFEGMRERLSIASAQYRVIEYLVDTSKKKETFICEIANIINNESITHIISDRGFSVVENCEETQQVLKKSCGIEFQKIDELIESIIEHLSENSIKQIKSFIIYSYDPFSNEIRREFRILRANMAKKVSDKLGISEKKLKGRIKTIESSSIYKRPGRTGIYPNRDKIDSLIGSFQACKFYGEFLADVLVNIIEDERTQQKGRINPYSYSKPQNYEMLKQIRSLEDLINNKDISIGSVSCYGNIYGKEEYLVDVPYKSYYDNINKEITRVSQIDGKSDLSLIFYNNQEKKHGFVKYEYVYFKYSVFEEDTILLNDIKLSDGLKGKDDICKQWLPLLHSSVFFCQENSWKNDILKSDNKPSGDPISVVNIFFSIIKLEEDDFHGTYNFTLYSEHPDINFKKIELYAYEKYAPLLESKLLELILPHKSKESKKQAVRAAISQVMARNMSHNIGSHVMNKLIDAVYLEKFCSYSNCLKSYNPLSDFKETIDHTAFKQLAIYNNYVKCRMDYLSDMSFGTPLMQTSKNMFEDVFRPLDKVRLLLENISGLSNFEYNIQFKKDNEPLGGKNDFPLAIPNDVLGSQALYNIIENVIRNTAKHTEKPKEFLTKFSIRFSDITAKQLAELDDTSKHEAQSLICVEIFDNINLANRDNKEIIIGDDKNLDSFAEEIKTNVTDTSYRIQYIDWLHYQQNYKINQSILSENNQLRASSLGLIEMEASAAYLRKIDLNLIDDDEYDVACNDKLANSYGKLNILKAVKVYNNHECYLGYRFFMLKPQEVLIVSDIFKSVDYKSKVEEFRNKGIWLITQDDFLKHLLDNNGVYNHQFVIHDNLDNLEIEVNEQADKVKVLDYFKTSLPHRILNLDEVKLADLVNKKTDEIIESCWDQWIKYLGLENALINNSIECNCTNPNRVECSLPNDRFRAVLIDHGKEGYDNWVKWKNCKKASFIEVLTSKALKQLPGTKNNDDIKKYVSTIDQYNQQYLKILESSSSIIVVIDERIQEFLNKKYYEDISYFEYFTMMRIFSPMLPNKENKEGFEAHAYDPKSYTFNLSANDMNFDFVKALKLTIANWCVSLHKNDYVLIHYSILERMFKNESNKLTAINDYIDSLYNTKCEIIITTGRGIIPGLTNKARFVNLSPIITSFIEITNKHLINYILSTTRKV